MIVQRRAGLTDNAWVQRIGELRQELYDNHGAMPGSYAEVAEWLLSDECETEYDLDDAEFLRREAARGRES